MKASVLADRRANTLLVVPNNDAEAAMMIRLARKLKLPVLISRQPHGARLENEPDVLSRISSAGKPRVCVVEIPGPVLEKELQKQVKEFVWIDHHRYDFLDRAHDAKTGKAKPSSLEQFLDYFGISDSELRQWGYAPKIVKGVGVSDRAYLWGLKKEGYAQRERKQVLELIDRLERTNVRQPGVPPKSVVMAAARRAWKARKIWEGFAVVRSRPKFGIRGELSSILAKKHGKPTPLILVERGGNRLYVQESPLAKQLFEQLGGFTFGGVDNWGYDNTQSKPRRNLEDIKRTLSLG